MILDGHDGLIGNVDVGGNNASDKGSYKSLFEEHAADLLSVLVEVVLGGHPVEYGEDVLLGSVGEDLEELGDGEIEELQFEDFGEVGGGDAEVAHGLEAELGDVVVDGLLDEGGECFEAFGLDDLLMGFGVFGETGDGERA